MLAFSIIFCSYSCFGIFHNSVEDVNDSDDWMAFFYPKMKVKPSSGCAFFGADPEIVSAGDCEYVCPSKVAVFKSLCRWMDLPFVGKQLWPDKTGGDLNCVCATTVFSCGDWDGFFGLFTNILGCFTLPMGPPPPPFCDNAIAESIYVKVVPLNVANTLDPKIKVRVGTDSRKRCIDSSEVNINDICSTGVDEIIVYNERILRPGENATIQYSGWDYQFSARLDGKKICASYANPENPSVDIDQCYDLVPMKEPIIDSFIGDTVTVKLANYNNGNPFNLIYGQENSDTGLFLFKPTVNNKRQFEYNEDGTFKENSNSSVLCIGRRLGPNDYSIVRANEPLRVKYLEKVFIPVKYDSNIGGYVVDDNPGRHSVNVTDSKQSVLDTAWLNNSSVTSIRPNLNQQEIFKYKMPIIMAANSNGIAEETTFVTFKENNPILLTTDEQNNLRYTDPYVRNLCAVKPSIFDFYDADNIEYREITTSDNCDFATIEAWGGGSASVAEVNTGSSGSYTKATINIEDSHSKRVLKVKVGSGGDLTNPQGQDTEVYMCTDNTGTNCDLLLTANGGEANAGVADYGNSANGDLFEKESFQGNVGLFKSNSDFPSVPVPFKLPKLPIQNLTHYPDIDEFSYVASRDTNCADVNQIQGNEANRSNIPGMGGCLSSTNNQIVQAGANGYVRLACEQWFN